MGLFDFFKKKNPIQEYMDGLFKKMRLVDVIAAWDIPIATLNGHENQPIPSALFFEELGFARFPPHRIKPPPTDGDCILWILDTFLVLELDSSNGALRQYLIFDPSNSYSHLKNEPLGDIVSGMGASMKMAELKANLQDPMMEYFVFMEAWNFFQKNVEQAHKIIEKKYSKGRIKDMSVVETQQRKPNAEVYQYLILKFDGLTQPLVMHRAVAGINTDVRERLIEQAKQIEGCLYSSPCDSLTLPVYQVGSRFPLDPEFTPVIVE